MEGTVINAYGVEIDIAAAVELMDDAIREDMCLESAWDTDQEFFDAYCRKHEERFGEEFELAKENPVW